jgi:hypothetical protein
MPSFSIPAAAAVGADAAGAAGAAAAASAGTAAAASAGTAAAAAAGSGGSILSGLALGSSALSAIGSITQGQAASRAAAYNAQVAANNAKIATQNANYAGAEGEAQVGIQNQRTRALVGSELAQQGASGINVHSGSDVDVRSSAAATGELSALTIRSEAAKRAYGYQTQAASDTGQEALDKSQSSSDATAGYINAGSTLLGTVANPNYNFGSFLNS